MSERALSWILFACYLGATLVLAARGARRTRGAAAFAIGSGQMSPWLAGITLGACLASSSLFVIMPGWVYTDGLPALLGFTVPLIAGFAAGLWLFAPRFQQHGARVRALTVPHWVGARYGSLALRRVFAALGVLQVTYLVLIVVGCGQVMEKTLHVPYDLAVVLAVVFVLSYTAFGGAWAHALTNSLQGIVMLVVAVVIFASGARFWRDGSLVADLAASGWTAPASPIFASHLEIWLVQFVLGVVLMNQPHLLTKALYVKGRRDLVITITVGMAVFAIYELVLFAGAYARLALPPGIARDEVVSRYLAEALPWPLLGAIVPVAILAASMSTIDGLLVSISASLANDVLPGRSSLALSRVVLVLIAAATILIALLPRDGSVLLLSQQGVFAFVAASAGPLLAGLYRKRVPPVSVALLSAGVALQVHYALVLLGVTQNPGVAACAALACGVPIAWLGGRSASLRGTIKD